MNRTIPFLRWFALCWCLALTSLTTFSQEEKVVLLEHADSLVGRVIDGEDVRELIGSVKIRQENVHITCDRALQFVKKGTVYLTGNVVLRDDSVTLTAPRAVYYRDERRAEAFDAVRLDDGKSVLTAGYGEYFFEPRRAFFRTRVLVRDSASTLLADSLTYFRDERRSIAEGHVTVHNDPDNVTISGGHMVHDARHEFSRMTVSPVLTQLDTSTSGRIDTLLVRSMVMESYRDSVQRLVAIDSVEILRADLAAVAALAVFYTRGDSILLRQSPVVWYQKTQVSGDSINVYLASRKLRQVSVMGNAFAASQSDSLRPDRFDQLTGDLLKMYFANQVLSRIEVDARAISVYHLYGDSLANGLNRTSGDRIIMMFDDGKVRSIKVVGGVEGNYYPENMVAKRESEYAIPGFLWRENRPTLRPQPKNRTETSWQKKTSHLQ